MRNIFIRPTGVAISGLLIALAYIGFLPSTHAQVIVPFTQRASVNTPSTLVYHIKGDFNMIGNTNMTLVNYGNGTNNSNNDMRYVDEDSDPNTHNSSMAELTFSTENGAIPECSEILYAGLYWTGRAHNAATSPNTFPITKNSVTVDFDKRKIELKGPGQSSYTTFTADPADIHYPTTSEGLMYSGYVEVTDYVQTHGLGEYWAANIALREGNGGATGYYGGWGMVVVYENSQMKWRDVTLFDGHAYVIGGTAQHELPVSGFQAVQSGDVNLKLGLMAGEGDVGISGDYFEIRDTTNQEWDRLVHSGNSTTNFFNGSVVTEGNRQDSIQNNTGLDIAMFNISNPNNEVVMNDQTSTRFRYGSTQDTYIIFCIAMAIDAYIPDVEGLVTTQFIDGVPVGSPPLTAEPGEEIEYMVQVFNQGTEAVDSAVFTIPIPPSTTYVNGSASDNIHFTPPPTPNSISFDPTLGPGGSIVWDLGTLPLPSHPDSVMADLIFSLRVTDNCYVLTNPNCPPEVVLSGGVTSGVGATTGVAFDNKPFIQGYETTGLCQGEPITDPITIDIDAASYITANCTETSENLEFTFCNVASTIPISDISGGMPDGTRYYDSFPVTGGSTEYTGSNPFPSTAGSNTYYAVPPGGEETGCHIEFAITVYVIASEPTAEDIDYCLNETADPLTATASNPSYTLYYYTSAAGGSPQVSITPSTATAGVTTYYVAEAITDSCISNNRVPLVVTVYDFDATITGQTNVLCFGASTGSATVTASGGSGSYSYSWDTTPVQTSATATGLSAGTYTVTVTDNDGCDIPETAMVTITQPASALDVDITDQQNVLCFGASTGTATALGSGGSGSYSYSWNTTPVQAGTMATGLSAGTYTVTLTDDNGCNETDTAMVTITQPASALDVDITDQQNVLCFGASTGTATALGSGGSGSYSYSWNTTPVQAGTMATGLSAGTYTVTLTDDNGCNETDTAMVTITQPASALDVDITDQQNVLCFGASTGTATALGSGGSGSYSYSWNTTPVQTGTMATGLSAGTYTVTLTDDNGCNETDTAMVTITQPASALDVDITGQQNVLCFSASTGTATALGSGGSGSYSYSWNTTPAQSGTTATGLAAGTYTVTLTDDNGCNETDTAMVTITQPPSALDVDITGQQNVLCFGASTGTATALGSGGSGSYSYSWNTTPAQSGTTATGLAAGTYTVTLTDDNGCNETDTAMVTITQPPSALDVDITGQQNVLCFGASTGTATALGSGGSGSYSYSWNTTPAQSGTTATGLAAGTYTVTLTDDNGCNETDTAMVTITQPPSALDVDITGQQNVLCFGASTGTATAAATGGSGSYSYSWNTTPPQSGTDASGLSAGYYTVTVSDDNGCEQTDTAIVHITQPEGALDVNITDQQNVLCYGASTGTATAAATGGSGSYSYSWNTTPPQSGTDASGLSAGYYTVTVSDDNGCEQTDTAIVHITQPEGALDVNITDQQNVLCYGASTGTATAAATGGSGSYSYSWNTTPPQSGTDASGLSAGYYTVTVSDDNGCEQTDTAIVHITQPEGALDVNITDQQNVLCFGASTGTATAAATGGSGSYSYSWNTTPPQSGSDASGLSAGYYTVTVSDDSGCEQTDTAIVHITQPEGALDVNITDQQNVLCFGASTGTATAAATGGSGSYSYSWNTTPPQSGTDASGLSAGYYTVTVSDDNGCEQTDTAIVHITQPEGALDVNITDQQNVLCFGASTGTATAAATGGSGSYSYSWNTTPPQSGTDASGLSAGYYTVTVSDDNGCEQTDTAIVHITQPASELAAEITSSIDVSCFGSSDGFATVAAVGGSGSYSYSWNTTPEQTTETASGLTGGTYMVTVTDNNGCETTIMETITLTEPDELGAVAASPSYNGNNISCNGDSNGAIDLNVSGGTAPFTFSWTGPNSFASSDEDLTELIAGTYSVTVTDANECTATTSITLTEPEQGLTSSISASDATCDAANGSAELTVMGGTPQYSFLWSDGSMQQNLEEVSAGTYSVIITDANECMLYDTVTIEGVSNIEVEAEFTNVSCYDDADAFIDLTIINGTAPYTFDWSNDSISEDITGIGAGEYDVIVTDGAGCIYQETFYISQPDPLTLELTSPTYVDDYNISSFMGTDGSITASADGGILPYTFTWTNGGQGETIYDLTAGTYGVVVTDSAGCMVEDTITLTEPQILEMPSGFSPNGDGFNDYFVIHGLDVLPDNELFVFNRWGQLIFQAKSYRNDWYGKNNKGEDMPAGTYFAILEINGQKALHGYVDLRRR